MPFQVTKVTYTFWLSLTSLTFKKRSKDTVALDAAYKAFCDFDTSPGHREAERLLLELDKYVHAKGGKWEKVERNKASGGYMQRLYDELKESLADHPAVARVVGKTLDDYAQERILTHDIPHSRLGVLYLLGNLDVNVDIVGAVIGGVSTMGAVGALGGISQFSDVAAGGAHSVTGLQSVALNAGTVHGVKAMGSTIVSGSQGVLGVAKGFVAGTGTASTTGYLPKALKLRDYKPDTEAVLREYRDVSAQEPEAGKLREAQRHIRNFVADVPVALSNAATRAKTSLSNLGSDIAIGSERFIYILGDILDAVRRKICVIWNLKPHELAAMGGKAIKAALSAALNHILTASMPYAGAAIQTVTGILKTVDAAVDKVRAYLDGKQISIMKGHPEVIANTLENQMSWGIGKGLLEVVKGGVNMTAQVLLPGLGQLATAIFSAVEWLTKTIMRIVEGSKLGAWLKEAQQMWKRAKLEHTYEPGDGRGGMTLQLNKGARRSIVYQTDEFTNWFQEGCDISPLVPMLVLNSGVCGSLMTMIRMVDDTGKRIEQREFDAGTRYMARLKNFSARYLRAAGFTIAPLNPEDRFLKNLLGHAVHDHEKSAKVASKLWSAAIA